MGPLGKQKANILLACLQVAKTKQKIEEQKVQVQVVERTQQIQLQDQEIIRKEKELEAQIKKPAEAERYRLEKIAKAERFTRCFPLLRSMFFTPYRHVYHLLFSLYRMKLITEAEAEAEAIKVSTHALHG